MTTRLSNSVLTRSTVIAVFVIVLAVFTYQNIGTTQEAQASPYQRQLVVDPVTVDIIQFFGSTNADVDNVFNKLSGAVNGSTTFKDIVKTAGIKHNNQLVISVYRNSTAVSVGDVPNNQPSNTCCTNIVHIDVGDTDLAGNFLDVNVGTTDDRNLVRNNFLTEVLVHEVYHTNNIADPQLNENPILADLQIFYRRLNYFGEIIGADKYLNFEIYSSNPVRNVRLDMTQYDRARNCGINPGFWEESPETCPSGGGGSVGGIGDLPDVQAVPEQSAPAGSNFAPFAIGGAAAAAFVAIGTLWVLRRRKSTR